MTFLLFITSICFMAAIAFTFISLEKIIIEKKPVIGWTACLTMLFWWVFYILHYFLKK